MKMKNISKGTSGVAEITYSSLVAYRIMSAWTFDIYSMGQESYAWSGDC